MKTLIPSHPLPGSRTSWTFRAACLSAVFCVLASQAAEPALSLFPAAKEYKGGFAPYGGTTVQIRKEEGVVALENHAKPAGFVFWFSNHKPLPKAAAGLWQNGSVQLEVRALNAPASLAVTAAWRGRAEPAQVGPASRFQTTIETDWTAVDIPLPDFSTLDGDHLTGLVIQFSKGGAYEMRALQIAGPAGSARAEPAATPASPAVQPSRQEADLAARRVLKSGAPDPVFEASHQRNLARARKGGVGCLLLGDSLIQGWLGHKDLWENVFGAYQPANFGVGGDGTQHLLWRIQNGELEGITPKVVVLMIGTNNTNWHDAAATARGVRCILETIQAKLPSARVLLLATLPRGEKPNPYRAKNDQLNAALREIADGEKLVFLDLGPRFLNPDGTISREIMPDYLHLSREGYEIWADAMRPALAGMMR